MMRTTASCQTINLGYLTLIKKGILDSKKFLMAKFTCVYRAMKHTYCKPHYW